MLNKQNILNNISENFHNKLIVLKCGGSFLNDDILLNQIIEEISYLSKNGIKFILIHGGGNEINQLCIKLNLPIYFIDGQRVTDKETMEIVQQSLHGKTNRKIISCFNKHNIPSIGISGQDSITIEANIRNENLGYVGNIININTNLIKHLLNGNYLPVISCLASDKNGNTYNINADIAAAEIAAALHADIFLLLTDTDGIYHNFEDKSSLIKEISKDKILKGIEEKIFTHGMIPKLEACILARDKNIEICRILNGKVPNNIIDVLIYNKTIGTKII